MEGRFGRERRSPGPGKGVGESRGTDCIFPKWPQQFFCSYIFFQNLPESSRTEQVESIFSPLELR